MIMVEIIDTYPIYSFGLVAVLRAAGCTVTAVRTSASDGVSSEANVVVVDPEALTGASPDTPHSPQHAPMLLLLPPIGMETATAQCESLGANGYVSRDVPTDQLVQAVRVVADGGRFMDLSPRPPDSLEQNPALSPRERQVLQRIARGMTHSQVARAMGISRHTVDTYVKRVRVKLELGNKAELTRAAVFAGLEQLN